MREREEIDPKAANKAGAHFQLETRKAERIGQDQVRWKDHERSSDAYLQCRLDEIEFLVSLFGTKS